MGQGMIGGCAALGVLWLLTGCAAHFSPSAVREEILRQRGADPLSVFEVNVGQFTTLLLRRTLADSAGQLPITGLKELQVAVFEAPAAKAPVIDVTRIATRGWDPVVKIHDQERSGMVLLRSSGALLGDSPNAMAAIADLVVIGAGHRSVVYARLKGRLSPKLPSALGDALRQSEPDELRDLFIELSEHAATT